MNWTAPPPTVQIHHLDQLWFQVAGTLCNLTCHHCFISCSPKNDTLGYLTLAEVERYLTQSIELGVREYYFTGGEPFLNPDFVPMLLRTLQLGPATVLTNGTVLQDGWLATLRAAEQQSEYSLEFRVSVDGFTAETNDPIRGKGTFDRAMRGIVKLVSYDFLPIITATRTWPLEQDNDVLKGFVDMLRARGYPRPRFKILPTLHRGAEVERTRGYRDDERITQDMLVGFDTSQLVCEHSRVVSDRGVHVCPILVDSEDSRMGDTLNDSLRPFPLHAAACFTCYQFGSICANPASNPSPRGQV